MGPTEPIPTLSNPHLMKVSSESVYKVALVLLQHLNQGLQLRQPETLCEGASGPEGCPGPRYQILTLHRVRFQARLPQSGPENTSADHRPKHPPKSEAKAVPPAGDAAVPLTGLACPEFATHAFNHCLSAVK